MPKGSQKDAFQRRLILAGICAGSALFLGLLGFIQFKPLIEAELYTRDLRIRFGQPAPISPEIVFIAIDKPTYKDILSDEEIASSPALAEMSTGSWPWRRSVWAQVIQRITDAGAKVVALDLMFPTPKEGDEELTQVMNERGDHAVLGGTFEEVSNAGRTSVQMTLPAAIASQGTKEIAKENPAGRIGYVNLWPDTDGIVRRADYQRQFQDTLAVSLTCRMLEKAGYADRVPANGSALLRFTGPPTFNYKSIALHNNYNIFYLRPTLRRTNLFVNTQFCLLIYISPLVSPYDT
jgi:CHASE2 domain-containing sensor protein